jgi:ParB family transcriptional regulator, chromosome partitioning protein
MPEMRYIPTTQLVEPPNPIRISMDDEKMRDLIDDIRAQGVIQSLAVIPAADKFEIVAGHRRYKAACAVGLSTLPCMIFTDETTARHAIMLAENTMREDVSAAEEAVWFAELIEKYDYTEEQLLKAVKRPVGYVYARLDLLKGNKDVFEAVRERKISLSVAQQLNRVDNADHCRYLCRMAVEGGATARTAMDWVKDYKANGPSPVVDLKPFVEAGREGRAMWDVPKCFMCNSNSYPANIVWVPIHDFERDALIQKVQEAAGLPRQDEDSGNPAANGQ